MIEPVFISFGCHRDSTRLKRSSVCRSALEIVVDVPSAIDLPS